LLDHVVLREPSPELAEKTGAVWETLWAALTFEVR
jgi:cobalt/nickel transport protein